MSSNKELEDELVPLLLDALDYMSMHGEKDELAVKLTPFLMDYAIKSLVLLNAYRKDGVFTDNEFPDLIGFSVNNLAAACAEATGEEDMERVAKYLRDRRSDNGLKRYLN